MISILGISNTSKINAQDWPNLEKYKNANAELKAPEAEENRVVFMGNSITEMWKDAHPEFFTDNPYINRGIGGQTTPQMLLRFRQDVIDLNPKVVVILAGTNDIAGNTGPMTLEQIHDNILSMVELAIANGIKPIVCSVLPAYDYPWRPGLEPNIKIPKLNLMLKTMASEKGAIYLDYFSEMTDDRNGLPSELTTDEVHVTKAGYEIMERMVKQAIDKAL
ncbi:MAG: SGNH/GDSL hydrolase family protein [Bacteroidota bacterium]|uniref:SGNH/GDSL hydrolase family protein n=1 Tax=Flagellimonas okinawensis TaxID=3031324 RepID=A0ABT5XI76_9FLAO|nr:SGNH/GDSL hydrolase family protein [[Muricauda] okinawensis]MDF0705600.1 SGNH/GDSL hydrolase family protein [[Muricauda] okinawensis]MEC8832600.1 SGNH/GDSL hydrolase family protein [Bacteroidota bacterium]